MRGWLAVFGGLALGCGASAPPPEVTARVAPTPAAPAGEDEESGPELGSKEEACYEGVGRFMRKLPRALTIRLFVGPDIGNLSTARAASEVVLDRFVSVGKGRVEVEVVVVDTDEDRQHATGLGFQPTQYDVGGDTVLGFFGFSLEYGDEREVIPVYSTSMLDGLPFWLLSKARELMARVDGATYRVGVVSSKGGVSVDDEALTATTSKPSPTLRGVLAQALPYYELVDVDLTADVDPELPGLLLMQPGEDFSDEALDRIDRFVMGGGTLVVVASAVDMPPHDAKMMAELDPHRLDVLLKGYGIELRSDLVVDPEAGLTIPVVTPKGTVQTESPAILRLSLAEGRGSFDASVASFFRMEELVFPMTSSLQLNPGRQRTAELRSIATTSDAAETLTGSPVDLSPTGPLARWKPTPGKGAKRVIAAVLEGDIQSARGAGHAEARVLVVASAHFLVNPFARAGNGPPVPPQMAMMGAMGGDAALQRMADPYAQRYLTASILAFKNTLDWMMHDEDLIACSALMTNRADQENEEETATAPPKCTKAQIVKLLKAGLSLDDAVEVCGKQPRRAE